MILQACQGAWSFPQAQWLKNVHPAAIWTHRIWSRAAADEYVEHETSWPDLPLCSWAIGSFHQSAASAAVAMDVGYHHCGGE